MSNLFKPGDVVRRVRSGHNYGWAEIHREQSLGDPYATEYTVKSVKPFTLCFSELIVESDTNWDYRNFELVRESPKTQPTNMISLKEHRTELYNAHITIDAIDNLTDLIKVYSVDKPGPAYVVFKYTETREAQIDRAIMVTALTAQRQRLIDYLATIGIDASVDE